MALSINPWQIRIFSDKLKRKSVISNPCRISTPEMVVKEVESMGLLHKTKLFLTGHTKNMVLIISLF